MTGRCEMATKSELASIVAEAEGVDPPTVALIARYVREAGFIQKKGRGPSAASMVVADAANLLIAVNASTSTIGAREVPIYRDLVGVEYDNEGRATRINSTFGEALELVIQSAIERRLPAIFLSKVVPSAMRDVFQEGKIEIRIEFEKPYPQAAIYIAAAMPDPSIIPKHRLSFRFLPMKRQKQTKTSDRKDHTEIGRNTIFSIAEILRLSRKT
jgi:hypothetical protein